jgi:protein-arginine kinase activator protein McsA
MTHKLPRWLLDCWHCGKEFASFSPLRRYCCYRCGNDAYIERRRQRRKEDREGLACQNCSRPFDAKRRDAKFCSNACRQAAHRNR